MTARIHPTALVEEDVTLGEGTSVWDNAHIRFGTRIGDQCIIGGKTYVAYDVQIGHRVKINASVYVCNGVTIEDGVMIGAHTVFTNDRFPRATTPDLKSLLPSEPDEHTQLTRVAAGSTIGAHCTIGSDLEIGRFAMVGMGSVVTRSVGAFHLVAGNPSRTIGYVCRCGEPTARFANAEAPVDQDLNCPVCDLRYHVADGNVTELNDNGD